MTKFYVAKVVRADGSRSRPLTLFADDDAHAQRLVSESAHGRRHETIHVADLAPDEQGRFNRWADDNNGVIEHLEFNYTNNGPIDVFTVFGPAPRKE